MPKHEDELSFFHSPACAMILVTGGTGFVGKALIRHLVEMDLPVRSLIRPSPRSPGLPVGVPVEVAVCGLNDPRGLRAAMVGVDTVYHLISGEWHGPAANLNEIDVQGTRAVVEAAVDAGVERFFYVSHMGADRASAYTVFKVKGIAEEFVRRSGMNYTILRSAMAYGPNDSFTSGLARILHATPGLFLLPGDGSTLLQPIWVEDLVTCLAWALEDSETHNRTLEIGGPEYLTFRQVAEMVIQTLGLRKTLVPVPPAYLRWITIWLESIFPGLPVSVYWLDYMAVNRTTSLDTVPRVFHLMPARMSQRLDYLRGQNWRRGLVRSMRQPTPRPSPKKTNPTPKT